MDNVSFRLASISDLPEMQQLFLDTVTEVCGKDYNRAQIQAWTSGVTDVRRWLDRFDEQYVLLSILDDQMAGFGTIKDGNYIDMFYVHKDFLGRGIARKMYRCLEEKAKELGSDQITSDVSITARPFFEKMGFIPVVEQRVERNGVELVNYRMIKEL